jgi:HlyD family secretion protein
MTTVPQSTQRLKLPKLPIPAIIAIVLAVAAAIALIISRSQSGAATTAGVSAPVTLGTLTAGISATGTIEPRTSADLAFSLREGRVAAILVEEGDTVSAGAPLIQVDARQATAEVAAAQAALAQAEADLQGLNEGSTAQEIAAAEAQVAAAQGALQQTQGSVTSSDIAAARAQLDEARARLASLTGRPNADALARAQASATQAQAELDRQRSALSAAKEQSRQAVEAAANRLRDAQSAFATARDNLASVEQDGKDPLTGVSLTDAGERSFRDVYAQAERAMQDAEAALGQARVSYEDTRQREITGLADAEARLSSAQADLDALTKPNADTLAAARAQLAAAEASLARLLGDQRAGALAAQEANLAQAQANLDRLLADPQASDLARVRASVAQAQANLDLAQIKLDDLTLRAPFEGVVARIDIAVGEEIGQGAPLTLIDISRMQVRVTVDEVDVARVQPGQPVDVLIDAIGAPTLAGSVVRVAPIAQIGSEVTAYEVLVEVTPGERPVRPGMTASAMIITDRRESALSVPAGAVRSENGSSVVTVLVTGADGKQQPATRAVQIGGTYGEQIEIVSGLSEGEQVQIGGAQ